MKKVLRLIAGVSVLSFLVISHSARSLDQDRYWMKVEAKDKFERTALAEMGYAIDYVGDDYVIIVGGTDDRRRLADTKRLLVSFQIDQTKAFPRGDEAFHDYPELTAKVTQLTNAHPDISKLISIGQTVEGRDIWAVRISGDLATAPAKPGIVFMGGHHAREHLSVELPIAYIEFLLQEYKAGNQRIVRLVNSRDIHFIPAVNPDGLEYDIATSSYRYWRKNRQQNSNGTYGVDLNRNYSYKWATGGASSNPSSETYHGPSAFSEPETRAIKNYVESNPNTNILLSFHTFSELILYPWGHTYDGIANARDRQAFEAMATKMAEWNKYKPQQSSDLYITSGDTTDWAYGEHGIFAFTFELDPKSQWEGGFYPGANVIPGVIAKNLEPILYLIEKAENPYQDLQTHAYRPF